MKRNASPDETKKWLLIFGLLFAIFIVNAVVGTFSQPHSPQQSTAPAATSQPVKLDKWHEQDEASPMDGTNGTILWLPAENDAVAWNKVIHPQLEISCYEKKTHVYVVTETPANPELGLFHEFTTRLRLDGNNPIKQRWGSSTDNQALYAPDGINLAKQLSKSKIFLFEFTPFNSDPVIIHFDIRGLGDHLPKVATECGWDVNKPVEHSEPSHGSYAHHLKRVY